MWLLAGLILLLPSSSIFPAADLAADRRMYLPLVAFSAAAALLLRPRHIAALAVIFCALSIGRAVVWRSERALWEEAVERSPGKVRPKIQLARAVPERAEVLLKQAQEIAPDDSRVPSELGRLYLGTGRPRDALEVFGRALALDPGNARAINNRGTALVALGQIDAARRDFERALAADPGLREARDNLARLGAR